VSVVLAMMKLITAKHLRELTGAEYDNIVAIRLRIVEKPPFGVEV